MTRAGRCSECGAVLKRGPARCPLCGAEPCGDARPVSAVVDVESYHARLNMLRAELRRLREGEPKAG